MTAPTVLSSTLEEEALNLTFDVVIPAEPASTIDLSDGFNGSCGFVGTLIYAGAGYINEDLPFLSYSAMDQQLTIELDEHVQAGSYNFLFRMMSADYDLQVDFPFTVTITNYVPQIGFAASFCIPHPIMENNLQSDLIRLT